MFEPGMLLSLAIAFIGAVVWAVRIEGRVNSHDKLFAERKEQADERNADIKERLIRIEQKLDKGRRAEQPVP